MNNLLDLFQKINGIIENRTLRVIKGESNLMLKHSIKRGLIPIRVDAKEVILLTFLLE